MLNKFLSQQARKPSGFFGRFIVPRFMTKVSASINAQMLELVDARGNDRILEIGFGSGDGVHAMASAVSDGVVEGVDFSSAMHAVATKLNKEHIDAGRVKLVHGDFITAPYSDDTFDTVCSTHTIYFWSDLEHALSRMFSILKFGGQAVLGFDDMSRSKGKKPDMEVFNFVTEASVRQALQNVGFSRVESHFVYGDDAKICLCAVK